MLACGCDAGNVGVVVVLPVEIETLGDSALIVRVRGTVVDVVNAARVIEEAAIAGVLEVTSSYDSVALFYDPVLVRAEGAPLPALEDHLRAQIREILSARRKRKVGRKRSDAIVIPVCFDAEFALDVAEVGQRSGRSAEAVIEVFCAAEYRVACVGFTPGFPYLSGLPPELATPRRSAPRISVPAGSVAIGGTQAGIYSQASPGGWNVIGRTPLVLFDVNRQPPALLAAGDRVRFRPIARSEFDAVAADEAGKRVQSPANKSQGEGSDSPTIAV
jgi:inhibitor of KinA